MNTRKIFFDRRFYVPLVVFSLIVGLCGLISGWQVMVRCLIFIFAALIPLVFGTVWIYRNFWWRPGWGVLVMAGLIGLIGFEIALLGLVINPGVRDGTWGVKLGEAAVVGILGFITTLTFGPLALLIARFFRS